jgi:hypothetical protein
VLGRVTKGGNYALMLESGEPAGGSPLFLAAVFLCEQRILEEVDKSKFSPMRMTSWE